MRSIQPSDRVGSLNDRERAVAVAAAHGAPAADIASWLGVEEIVVLFHLERACRKLGVPVEDLPRHLRRYACTRVA